jgi:hypothetical protein
VAGTRDIPGVNVVKIINGSWDSTPPVGGALLYSGAGGVIHSVDEAGNDTNLTNGSLGSFLVAGLPAAPPALTRAFVTDALGPVFAAAVVGGGAVLAPVYFDGAVWLCG